MPLGVNRTDLNTDQETFKDGNPVTEPKNFGTPVTTPVDFGNTIPSDSKNENLVTWNPTPTHFGNIDPDEAS